MKDTVGETFSKSLSSFAGKYSPSETNRRVCCP